ncbi:hypothetical protein [Indiicoccus explosivorum]|uniref:hypothetical protein n=1 Tax=Indiicoccus explosivorum TaxID=1917864 RepID=UPI000B453DB8|nr:hypothetical protein [Indiicoccus explosivorum]
MFAIANIETLHARDLAVVHVYGSTDNNDVHHLVDQLMRPFESNEQVIDMLREYDVTEVYTADYSLFSALLQTPGIKGEIKHRLDVAETKRAVDQYADMLIDVLEIELTDEEPPPLPKWKTYLIRKLEGLIEWLRN